MLTTEYKSKIIKLKLDEDPLQRQIYFFDFVESLEIISPQYKETCEVILYYPTIVGEGIKYYVKRKLGIFYTKTLMSIVEG